MPAFPFASAGRRRSPPASPTTDRPVELVVNNAGFGVGGTFHELTVQRLAAEIEVDVAALTRLSHRRPG